MFKYVIDNSSFLTLLEIKDSDKLYELVNSNREYISEWLTFPEQTLKIDDSRAFIERNRIKFAKEEGYWLGIWHENKLAGSIGYLYNDQENKKTEIGYWLGKTYEGKGLITKSIKVLIKNAFEVLLLNKVEIGAAADNLRSRAIPEKLGFRFEGEIRDYEFINGRFINRRIYGLTADEWVSEQNMFK
jgi:ribosomal-protein-serine acetyltransferase